MQLAILHVQPSQPAINNMQDVLSRLPTFFKAILQGGHQHPVHECVIASQLQPWRLAELERLGIDAVKCSAEVTARLPDRCRACARRTRRPNSAAFAGGRCALNNNHAGSLSMAAFCVHTT